MNAWKQKILTGFLALWRRNVDQPFAEYADLGQKKALLADIARRGGIYSAEFVPDQRKADWMEGRRALALEILTLARTDPDELRKVADMIERTGK